MTKTTEKEVQEAFDELKKYGWHYLGFDRLNVNDLFQKYLDYGIFRVTFDSDSIEYYGFRVDNLEPFYREALVCRLSHKEYKLFNLIFEYVVETRKILDNVLTPENQEELDNAFEFELGFTNCKVE